MPRKPGNPWLRFDVQTYADAKIRIGRCGAVWPWCLTVLKRCGGAAADEDLDPMLAAADLSIPLELAAEQLDGAKRVGLLVDDGEGGWTTRNWKLYQADPRKRSDRRDPDGPRDPQGRPGTPREQGLGPRESGGGPRSSRFDPVYGTGRDDTGRDSEQQRAGAREGQAVEQVEPHSLPDPGEQGERIAATLADLDSDEHAGKAKAHQRLLTSLRHRGCEPTQHHLGEMATMLASRPTAVIAQLGVMVERGSGPIRSPVGLLKSLLPDALEAVENEAKARRIIEARNAESRRQAERRQAAQQWMRDNPEKAAENARRLAALAESLGGGS